MMIRDNDKRCWYGMLIRHVDTGWWYGMMIQNDDTEWYDGWVSCCCQCKQCCMCIRHDPYDRFIEWYIHSSRSVCTCTEQSTGSDSPVIMLWSTLRDEFWMIRQSPGILSPLCRRITSPVHWMNQCIQSMRKTIESFDWNAAAAAGWRGSRFVWSWM